MNKGDYFLTQRFQHISDRQRDSPIDYSKQDTSGHFRSSSDDISSDEEVLLDEKHRGSIISIRK